MTERRSLEDPYERTVEARVERATGEAVVLDRTPFYPEGGGQPADRGTLTDGERTWAVRDVTGRDEVVHHLDGDPPPAGTTVEGSIDWERRYAHMRYHTAQHLLSAFLLETFDAPTTGNQLYADRARIDVAHDRFEDADLRVVEEGVNDLVAAGLSVEWYTLSRERAEADLDPERTRLDLLPESVTEVRIVEIGDGEVVDRTACAGTHVRNTEEVGRFGVTGRETKGSDEERLRFELAAGDEPDDG